MSLFRKASYGTVLVLVLSWFSVACAAASPGSTVEDSSAPSPSETLESPEVSMPENPPESPTSVKAVSPTDTPVPTSDADRPSTFGPQAKEIEGIAAWINSEPLTLAELRGKVVLIDFWTYTCINCIRTLPFLKVWDARYRDDGLVIVGVHTPEFEFEKNYDNVVEAVRENGVSWPVAQDNDFVTWNNYSNRYWPAKYLIDSEGVVRYTHFGEGAYRETEEQIRTLLLEGGVDLSENELSVPEDQPLDPAFKQIRDAEITPELYAGYQRNYSAVMFGGRPYVIQPAYYEDPDTVVELTASEELVPHTINFQGPWLIEAERAKHGRSTGGYEDYIAVRYSAKSVNAVLTSDTGEPYRVRVTVDGAFLTAENRGADIMIGEDGESFLLVNEPRLYQVVANPQYVQGRELRMSSDSADFGLFAFTFGIYQDGP